MSSIRQRLYGALGIAPRVQKRIERTLGGHARKNSFPYLRQAAIEYESGEPVEAVGIRKGMHLDSRPVDFRPAWWPMAKTQTATENGCALTGGKPKIVVANTFPAWPAQGGGRVRVLNIYAHLSERMDVTLVSLSSVAAKLQTVIFGNHFREIVVPQALAHGEFEDRFRYKLDGMSVTDIAAIHGLALTPMFEGTLKCALAGAVLAVAEHPYCFNALRRVWSGPIVYSAHNVESLLKAAMLPKTKSGKLALDEVEAIERACCHHASRILVVSEQDAATMVDRYGASRDKLAVVPNGTNIPRKPVLDFLQREKNKQRLSLCAPLALYMGSLHGPNLEGAIRVYEIARQVPDWHFLLVGSMCDASSIRSAPKPPNVDLLGLLDRRELAAIMAAADVGLNPVIDGGGGSNLKILDYAANGLLVLTTAVGNRGIVLRDGEQCIVAEPEDMPAVLMNISERGPIAFNPMVRAGFDYVSMNYSWQDIVSRIHLPTMS